MSRRVDVIFVGQNRVERVDKVARSFLVVDSSTRFLRLVDSSTRRLPNNAIGLIYKVAFGNTGFENKK